MVFSLCYGWLYSKHLFHNEFVKTYIYIDGVGRFKGTSSYFIFTYIV